MQTDLVARHQEPIINDTETCLHIQETAVIDDEEFEDDRRQHCNFEDIIVAMGPPGKYQILQSLLMSASFLPAVFVSMSFVYTGLETPFSCSQMNDTLLQEVLFDTDNATTYKATYEECEIRITSNRSGRIEDVDIFGCKEGYNYKGGKHVSIITEWDLVCDSRGIGEMVQSFVALGLFIGISLITISSDKYGRKKSLIIAIALSSITELSSAFAPNVYVVISLRFLSGLFVSGVCTVAFVLGAEMLVSKHREIFTLFFGFMWSFFGLLLSCIGYLFRDESWRNLQICIGLCCMSCLLSFFFVDESASWLYSQGNYEHATLNIKKACRLNGVDFYKIKNTWDRLCRIQEKKLNKIDENGAVSYNILDVFRNAKLRVYIFISWLTAMTTDLSYFGMYLSASTLAGNMYLNIALMAILEFPGTLLTYIMLKYKGRRFVVILFMVIAAMCLLVSTVLGSTVTVTTQTQHIVNTSTAFFLIGRMAVSNSYTTIFLYIPELFPTTHRTSGTGFSFTGSCLGGMIAPFLVPLYAMASWAPGTCLIVSLIISALLLFKLPESKGKQLASTIE